jgi:transcriptional regulator with XRE-family HTH domain
MNELAFIRIKVLRISQDRMAEVASTSQPQVSRWERGMAEPTRMEMVRIRAEAQRLRRAWDDSWFFKRPARTAHRRKEAGNGRARESNRPSQIDNARAVG